MTSHLNYSLFPHFSTQNHDTCHGTIGSYMIEIQSHPDRKSGTLYIVDGILIGNKHLYYMW